jgi:CDP-4-dehydro-6-deoxyglucose reductase
MPRVTVKPEGVSVDLLDDETILDGLFRNGYAFRVGCRRGGCAICMVDLVEGDVEYNRPIADKVLNEEDKAAGACLSCRAVPLTDVTITLREENLRTVNPLMALFAASKPQG